MDYEFDQAAARATEAAAAAASALIGRGDENAAEAAAARAMRAALAAEAMRGRVVVGEGEVDEVEALYVGETLGAGAGPRLDLAVDPLEGATLAAKAMSGAMTLLAVAPEGGLFKAPRVRMDKIAVGPGYPPGVVDLDAPAPDNVRALARAKGVDPRDVRVCVLDRPRHGELIAGLRSVGAQVLLISDGDVAGVINTSDPEAHADVYMGQGGAPEAVLACAALKCAGGQFQGRLVFSSEAERDRARRFGVAEGDLQRRLDLEDLVRGEAVFAATGVTSGPLLDGARREKGFLTLHSLVMNARTRQVLELKSRRPING